MARVSSAPEGGKFRARAATALNGTAGNWGGAAGLENLLCVRVTTAGELIVATLTECDGVIDVTEGKSAKAASLASYRQAIGGKRYTVLRQAQIQDIEDGTLVAGNKLFSRASGDAGVGPTGGAGAIFLGIVLPDETQRASGGLVLHLDVNGAPVGTA